jgi:hypothetical protein
VTQGVAVHKGLYRTGHIAIVSSRVL